MNMNLPLVAIGPNLVPALERCVGGVVVDRGWEEKRRPARLAERALPVECDGIPLMATSAAIDLGRKLAGFSTTERALDRQRPLTDLALEFDLTLAQARMCIRLFVASEKNMVNADRPLREAERDAGIRDYFGNLCGDFK